MVEKYKLNLAIAFTILLITIWLTWTGRVWEWVGQLLLVGAIVLIIWTMVLREKRPAKLLEFFVKSLIVSYVATIIIWFVWLRITSPQFYAYLDLEYLMNELILVVLPLSLLPVAVSVIVYGTFRTKLKPWEIFLPTWYASIFAVFIIYNVWWSLCVRPYLPEFYYSSFAGWMASVLGLVFLSFLVAIILTIVYVVLRKQKTAEPKLLS